jgi:glycosyltransferase involved in cell wall biosynthesis
VTTISVIIATYNRAQYIGETVRDILRQEPFGGSLEVIVIDDGSTDETEAALREFGPRIRFGRIPHSGLPAVARNRALAMASGDFVSFQDSDDFWATDKLRAQMRSFVDDPTLVMSYGNSEYVRADGSMTGEVVYSPRQQLSGFVFEQLLAANFVSGHTPLIRRDVLEKVGRFNEAAALRGMEDYQLWLRVAAAGKIKSEQRVLAYYRQHPTNLSAHANRDAITSTIAVYRSLLDDLEPRLHPLVYRRLATIHSASGRRVRGHLYAAAGIGAHIANSVRRPLDRRDGFHTDVGAL